MSHGACDLCRTVGMRYGLRYEGIGRFVFREFGAWEMKQTRWFCASCYKRLERAIEDVEYGLVRGEPKLTA